jgi:hypothetical protein
VGTANVQRGGSNRDGDLRSLEAHLGAVAELLGGVVHVGRVVVVGHVVEKLISSKEECWLGWCVRENKSLEQHALLHHTGITDTGRHAVGQLRDPK